MISMLFYPLYLPFLSPFFTGKKMHTIKTILSFKYTCRTIADLYIYIYERGNTLLFKTTHLNFAVKCLNS